MAVATTPTIGLKKPDDTEFYDIEVPNANSDIIDAEFKRVSTQLKEVDKRLGTKLDVPSAIAENADLNAFRTPGMFFIGYGGTSIKNTPTQTGSFSLFVEKNGSWGDVGAKQTFSNFSSGATYIRVTDGAENWGGWTLLATATSGTWTPELTDINGHKAALSADTYGKWSLIGNIMLVTATIKVASKAGLDNSGLLINGLPRAASPAYQGGVPGLCSGLSAQTIIQVQTTYNGKINLYKPSGSGGVSRLTVSDITDGFALEGLSISYMT